MFIIARQCLGCTGPIQKALAFIDLFKERQTTGTRIAWHDAKHLKRYQLRE